MKYELTITLKPLMYVHKPQEQFNLTHHILFDIFQDYHVTAIADLTNEHNVHYHCMIELPTLIDKDRLLNKFRKWNKIFGKKTCTQVMYEDTWRKYIRDKLPLWKGLLADPIVRDSYSLFSMNTFEVFPLIS